MLANRSRWGFNICLILLPVLLCAIGLLVLYSASRNVAAARGIDYTMRQAVWAVAGICTGLLIGKIDYRKLLDWSYLFYAFSCTLLVLLFLFADARMGARRWLSVGGIAFQPSEFAKIAFILASAYYLGNNRHGLKNMRSCAIPFLMLAVPFSLIAKEPDLGSALVFLPVIFAMLYAAGLPGKYIALAGTAGGAAAPLFWHFLKDYQRTRLLVFINPNLDPLGAGYTIIQSKIAVGSGGLFGKGWLKGTQSQLNFLPEHHTDFIFSTVGEEWGFLGAALVIFLFLLFFTAALAVTGRTNDVYGRLIVAGATVMLAFQTMVNIGMTVGLMPVVGIPLPFISAGGSSMIAAFICVGLLISVDTYRTTF